MRLGGAHAAVRRIWTVELRPRAGGPTLVCPSCTAHTSPLTASSARSAALAHLACHARADALPAYLRSCQCRVQGCLWHPRRRGCGGPVLLALTRDRSGRTWRLADTCAACAAATSHTAVVPDTLVNSPRPLPSACAPPQPLVGLRGGVRPAAAGAGDAHLPRRRAAPVHLPRRPAAGPAVRPSHQQPRACPAADGSAARHAPGRAPGAVAGAGPRRLAGAAGRQVGARAGAAARCRGPGPGARSPCPLPRRPLGAASRPVGLAGRAARPAADRSGAGRTHVRRCRTQRRYGRPRPPVRAQPAADRRASRPAGDHPHTGSLAPQPGDRRGALAPARSLVHEPALRYGPAATRHRGVEAGSGQRTGRSHRPSSGAVHMVAAVRPAKRPLVRRGKGRWPVCRSRTRTGCRR